MIIITDIWLLSRVLNIKRTLPHWLRDENFTLGVESLYGGPFKTRLERGITGLNVVHCKKTRISNLEHQIVCMGVGAVEEVIRETVIALINGKNRSRYFSPRRLSPLFFRRKKANNFRGKILILMVRSDWRQTIFDLYFLESGKLLSNRFILGI